MNERETVVFITPKGRTVKAYTYLTELEYRALQNPYFRTAEEFPKQLIDDKGLKAAILDTVNNLTIKTLIVELDSKKDGQDGFNLLDAFLSLPKSESRFIIKKLNEITSDEEKEEEKKTN